MLKAALGVFIRATWRLDHAIERDEFSDDQCSHSNPAGVTPYGAWESDR